MIYCPWHVITSFLCQKCLEMNQRSEGSSLRSVSPAVFPQAKRLSQQPRDPSPQWDGSGGTFPPHGG